MIFDHSQDKISPDDQSVLTLSSDVDVIGALDVTSTVTGVSFNSITGLSSDLPLEAGTASAGTSTLVARADHVHPPQTTAIENAATATKLLNARLINGTSFDGTANITTSSWGTARNITIGLTTKSVDGSSNVSWSLAEIGASGGSSGPAIRNKILNGAMEVGQRGTSFPALPTGSYTLDRWRLSYVSSAVVTMSQQTTSFADTGFPLFLQSQVTTADTAIAAGDWWAIQQPIEGFNIIDLVGVTFNLSFWVKSSNVGVHCVALTNDGADRSYVAEFTVSAANTWEFKSITVTGGLPTDGTWNYTTGMGLRLSWTLMSGSTFRTTPNTWQTGLFYATANQVNCVETVGNIFALTGVQLATGATPTQFERRHYATEVAMCQRYYEIGIFQTQISQTTTMTASTQYQVRKRATPTRAFADFAGNASKFTRGATNNQSLSFGVLAGSLDALIFDGAPTVSMP